MVFIKTLLSVFGAITLSIGLFMFLDGTGIYRFVRRDRSRSEPRQKRINLFGTVMGVVFTLLAIVLIIVAFFVRSA